MIHNLNLTLTKLSATITAETYKRLQEGRQTMMRMGFGLVAIVMGVYNFFQNYNANNNSILTALYLFFIFFGGLLIADWIDDIVAKPLREIADTLSSKEPRENREKESDLPPAGL